MEILNYGLSMYGGYYINYFNGKYNGVHGRTLKEACEKLGITKAELKGVTRKDN
jgi:hypothetical protein